MFSDSLLYLHELQIFIGIYNINNKWLVPFELETYSSRFLIWPSNKQHNDLSHSSLVLVLNLRTFSHLAKLVFLPLFNFYFANSIIFIWTLLSSMYYFPAVWLCSATVCRKFSTLKSEMVSLWLFCLRALKLFVQYIH